MPRWTPAAWRRCGAFPADSDPDGVLLHSHMGGTVVASMHSDRKAAAHLARAAGVRSLVLNFRRSPEHKFPAQIEDVRNAYDWLLQKGYQPENIASVGHSVGGNFAVGLALGLRDEGAALPGAIVSISPWVDLTLSNENDTRNADSDRLLSRPLRSSSARRWLDGTGVDFADPRVSLLGADLSGLPPIAVFWGSDEVLAGEDAEFARLAEAAGNDVLVRAGRGRAALVHHRCRPGARSRHGDRRDRRLAAEATRALTSPAVESLPRQGVPSARDFLRRRGRGD